MENQQQSETSIKGTMNVKAILAPWPNYYPMSEALTGAEIKFGTTWLDKHQLITIIVEPEKEELLSQILAKFKVRYDRELVPNIVNIYFSMWGPVD